MVKKLLFFLIILSFNLSSFSQSYNDGPITLDVKLREVQGNFADTDEVFYSDNIDYHWNGGKGVSGSYGYVINVVDKLGEFHQVKRNVLLE
ncbi:MAG: hypothetical protein ACKVG7_04945 [Flavobacteriales bacterium]